MPINDDAFRNGVIRLSFLTESQRKTKLEMLASNSMCLENEGNIF